MELIVRRNYWQIRVVLLASVKRWHQHLSDVAFDEIMRCSCLDVFSKELLRVHRFGEAISNTTAGLTVGQWHIPVVLVVPFSRLCCAFLGSSCGWPA